MIYEFFSGSYAEPGEDGIVKLRLDTDVGTLTKVFSYRGIKNPSFIQLNTDKTVLYAVQEEKPTGAVHALRVKENKLVPINSLQTKGADPCHICLTADKQLLLASNYTSGSLAICRLGENGELTERSQLIVHEGRGTHPTRQEGPHIHYAMEQGEQVYVVDLGLDQVFVYRVDHEKFKLIDSDVRLAVPPGGGPRHIVFFPTGREILYVICELSNEVCVYQRGKENFSLLHRYPTLPSAFQGQNTAAAIKERNSLMFASNRGHDSIAVFRIAENGVLELKQIASSVGSGPRDFELFGDFMVVANQYSGTINVLKINWDAGTLEDTGIFYRTPQPCCIQIY